MIESTLRNEVPLRFAHLLKAPVSISLYHGENFQLQEANEKALEMLGGSLAELRGRPLGEILPGLFTDARIAQMRSAVFSSKKAFELKEAQAELSRQGQKRVAWLDVTADALTDDSGLVTGSVVVATDVSDRVNARKMAEAREERVANFFEKAPVGIVCYKGSDFVVDLVNDRVLEMWGKTREEVKGRRMQDIFPEIITEKYLQDLHQVSLGKFERGEAHIVNEVELSFVRGGVSQRGWYSYIHEPYRDGLGNVVGIIAVAIEVTDQVMARKRVDEVSQKLQLITDALPSLIAYINKDGVYEFNNKAYEKWFGRSRDEITGKDLRSVLGADAYDRIAPHMRKVMSGEPSHWESWVPYKEGGERFVSANYMPHKNEHGDVMGLFSLVTDLTDRKLQEEALQRSEEIFRIATEAVDAGTFEMDLKRNTLYWSARLKTLNGFSPDEIITPEKATSVLYPDDFDLVMNQFTSAPGRLPGEDLKLEHRIVRHGDGQVRWVHVRFKTFFEGEPAAERLVRTIGFVIDVTEEKEKEERLRQLSSRLEEEVRQRTSELKTVNDMLNHRNTELTNAHSWLEQLLDSSVEYIAVFDTDFRYLTVNRRYERLLGKEKKEFSGKRIAEIQPIMQEAAMAGHFGQALNGHPVYVRKHPAHGLPGLWFDMYFTPLVLNDKVGGVIVMSRDVTVAVKAEQQLERINRLLHETQTLSRLGSWEWDIASGRIEWSDQVFRIYGYEERFELNYEKANERMDPAYRRDSAFRFREHVRKAKENFSETGQRVHEMSPIEFPIILPDGTRKIVRNSGSLELSREGEVVRLYGALQDVTAMRATEDQLNEVIVQLAESNAALESQNRELESFNYVASHDLKEPLRKIQTYISRVLEADTKEEDRQRYLQKVTEAAKRMSALIESLLTFTRMSKTDDAAEMVDLNVIFATVKADLEILITEKHAVVESVHLPKLRASAPQLSQLFSNLISNSLKFSKDAPVIRISYKVVAGRSAPFKGAISGRDYLQLQFQDNGIGFDAKFNEEIFRLFSRLHPKSEFEGSGIGLSTVKKIVDRHKGGIAVQSEVGKGTVFTVWLPIV